MAGNKYISNSSGTLQEVIANQVSAGAGDAGKIVALNSTGQLDTTMMPTGIAPDTAAITASEALSAGAFVNVWNNAGAFNARNADGSTSGKEAHGFVLSAVASSGTATVYFNGTNNQVTGMSPGMTYLSGTTPGGAVASAPTGSGKTVQRLGLATSATSINYTLQPGIVLA